MWKKIPGLSRYSISEDGVVRRDVLIYRTPPGIVKASINQYGYWRVTLRADDGKQITKEVHCFVALAFLGTRPPGMVVRHRDGNKLNNHVGNLLYGTPAENIADMIVHGTTPYGTRHSGARLKESDIPDIAKLLASGKHTQEQIGAMFGVSQRAIWQVAAGKKWRHITGGVPMKRNTRGAKTRRSGQPAVGVL